MSKKRFSSLHLDCESSKALAMTNSILITGASGFIGSALANALSNDYRVVGIARKKKQLHNWRYLYADIGSEGFEKLLPNKVECVIHLAQSREYRSFPDGAADMLRINIDATCKLLEYSRQNGVKQFIYASTANVYGQSTEALTEKCATTPTSFYGATKLSAEHLIKQYSKFFKVDILRLFTVYGFGQESMLIPNLIEQIKVGKTIVLAQNAGIYLSPVYVDDVLRIIRNLIDVSANPGLRLVNVCGDQVVSLGEIVQELEQQLGVKAVIQSNDDSPPRFIGSNAAIKGYLGPIQFIDLKMGLKKMLSDDVN
jgi:nucleoside-diphosphate-sugar epimerase